MIWNSLSHVIENFLRNMSVKEFWKSVIICWNYVQKVKGLFFIETRCRSAWLMNDTIFWFLLCLSSWAAEVPLGHNCMQYYMLTVAFPAFTKWGATQKENKNMRGRKKFWYWLCMWNCKKTGHPLNPGTNTAYSGKPSPWGSLPPNENATTCLEHVLNVHVST